MPLLPPPLCDGMGSCSPAHSQGSSYCSKVLTSPQHAQIQSMYHGSYQCSLYANETIRGQPRASYIYRIEALHPAAPSELFGSTISSFDHHTPGVATHQSPCQSCILVA